MKICLIIFILIISNIPLAAQQDKIEKLLNKQFNYEQNLYEEGISSKPQLIQTFQIQKDSLVFEFTMPDYNEENRIKFIRRSVHLKDIEEFIKDMNVIFLAKEDSVKETVTIKDRQGNTIEKKEYLTHLFFTELGKDYGDESLRNQMLKAFAKAGYRITSEYWFH